MNMTININVAKATIAYFLKDKCHFVNMSLKDYINSVMSN